MSYIKIIVEAQTCCHVAPSRCRTPVPGFFRPALLRTHRRHTAPLNAAGWAARLSPCFAAHADAARFVAALGRARVAFAAAHTSLHRRCRLVLLHTPDVVTSRLFAATRLYPLVGRLASQRLLIFLQPLATQRRPMPLAGTLVRSSRLVAHPPHGSLTPNRTQPSPLCSAPSPLLILCSRC